eukprot:gene18380-24078_t
MSENDQRDYRDNDDDNYDDRRQDRRQDRQESSGHDDGNPSLHLSALSFESTQESIKRAFEKFGPVEKVSIILDPLTFKSRGFGFLKFANAADADRALEAMNGVEFEGRTIKVDKAKRAEGYAKTPGQYMGNPILRAKGGFRDDRRGDYRDDRVRRDSSRDRRYGGYREERYERDFKRDSRDRYPRDDREYRAPPPRYDERSRYPPRGYDDRRPRDDYR